MMDFNSYFRSGRLFVIAGQCIIESESATLYHAEKLKEITSKLNVPFVYKSSFRKANRSAHDSFTGLGMERGLAILARVKEQFDVPVISDVHEVAECAVAAEVCEALQLPAFLMRQSALLTAAGLTGKVINIKKAQFASPYDMKYAVEKIEVTGNRKILLTERGTSFGYGSLVVDMKSFPIMKELGYPTVIDCTHSTQMRIVGNPVSGGDRRFTPTIAKAAIAAGAAGIFAEVHQDPPRAKSDASTQWALDDFEILLKELVEVYQTIN